MKILIIILTIFLTGCKLNKVVKHHGIHNLENKNKVLIVNKTNINQINALLGPPSTKSYFDNNLLVYLERKTSNSKLLKFGKKKLIANNVLLLEVDNRGMLVKKKFLTQSDINKIEFSKKNTNVEFGKQSFIYRALSNLKTKINDPLGKKRGSLKK